MMHASQFLLRIWQSFMKIFVTINNYFFFFTWVGVLAKYATHYSHKGNKREKVKGKIKRSKT